MVLFGLVYCAVSSRVNCISGLFTIFHRSPLIKYGASSDPLPPVSRLIHVLFASFISNSECLNPKTSGWISRNKLTVFKEMTYGGRKRRVHYMKAKGFNPVLMNW